LATLERRRGTVITMGVRERILVLGTDDLFRRAASRVMAGIAEIVAVGSASDASAALADGPVAAYLILAPFGLEWLDATRDSGHVAPALLLTLSEENSYSRRGRDIETTVARKPVQPETLRAFATAAVVKSLAPSMPTPLAKALVRLAARRALSRGELSILCASLAGSAPREFAGVHSISVNTYKTRVRRLLRKVGHASIGEIRDQVLRDAHEWLSD
jgi:DNA-binding NarL/FixJ family response regulator